MDNFCMFQKHPPIITMAKYQGNTARGLKPQVRKGSANSGQQSNRDHKKSTDNVEELKKSLKVIKAKGHKQETVT